MIRDDYPHVPSEDVTHIIKAEEFNTTSLLLSGIQNFKTINTKTANSLYFLGLAYRSRKWLEALIFHVCALETVTSSTEWENKITRKFVNRLNNFIGYDERKLEKIYNIRSELVHGRYSADSDTDNLKYFMIAEEVTRLTFNKILLNKELIDSFYDDEERMNLFEP